MNYKAVFACLMTLCVGSYAQDNVIVNYLNKTNGSVFKIEAGTGIATVAVNGVISGATITGGSYSSPSVVAGSLTVQTNATIGTTLTVTGAVSSGTSVATPVATLGRLTVQTNVTIGGTLTSTGAYTSVGAATFQSAATFASSVNVTGTLTSAGLSNGGAFVMTLDDTTFDVQGSVDLKWGVQTIAVTNNQVVSLANDFGRVRSYTGSGGAQVTNFFATLSSTHVNKEIWILNVGTNDLVFPETAPLISAGALTLGQYDSVWLFIENTNRIIQRTAVMDN